LTTTTHYAPFQGFNEFRQTFCCQQQNDRFTVSNEKGNGALTYPIGLITSDELQYAGLANGWLNKLTYVYAYPSFWTMSPSYYSSASLTSSILALGDRGDMTTWHHVINSFGYRAVINLKGDVEIIEGIGTAHNPFLISERQ